MSGALRTQRFHMSWTVAQTLLRNDEALTLEVFDEAQHGVGRERMLHQACLGIGALGLDPKVGFEMSRSPSLRR